uniref:Auxin response factor n=1 Tax=Eucommia ulmoides TaxID=4392 RepID=A0A649UIM7_EUCUL|nr:ARF16 [Eucommia ulmoides]
MNSVSQAMNEVEKSLDSQLWHACAGGMVQMPPANSKVFYFPQGHAEHANGAVDFGNFQRIPPLILCRVSNIKFMADTETDEVYARIRLVPLKNHDSDLGENGLLGFDKNEVQDKPNSFAKTLTQSDANNGGGFSVPRYCAETIFPRLDYSAEPPVQTILVKDVHGEVWKFRHIYRGTPRRHLLTTGWSNFVNRKKLIAGDSIVFLRAENGDLRVGIRRAKRGIGSGNESPPSGWNTGAGAGALYGGSFSGFSREDGSNFDGGSKGRGKVGVESVVEAATLAAAGRQFEVVYYPRASSPEFCVKAAAVKEAMQVQWCSGIRFKMAFETEDSSRISWFMGTISNVQVEDPIRWPNSPWRLLQVAWDEPDLLQNVKRVSPWLVELVSNMPAVHLSPFSPPRKKLRLPPPPPDFPLVGHNFPVVPPFFTANYHNQHPLRTSSALCCVSDNNVSAGIQGARHPPLSSFGLSPPQPPKQVAVAAADLRLKLHSGLIPFGLQQIDRSAPPRFDDENVHCLLTIGNSNSTLDSNRINESKTPKFLLFGQPILTEQQLSMSSSGETAGNSSSGPEKTANGPPETSSDEGAVWYKDQKYDFGLETAGNCKVFMESDDVGRTVDLSMLRSYEELYKKLANMYGIERSEMLSNVLYRSSTGAVKHTGDEPFSEFLKAARRLTILMDSGSDNIAR